MKPTVRCAAPQLIGRALGSIDPVSCTDEACLFYLDFDPGGVGQFGWAVGTFWTTAGVRNVDNLVRRAMHARGAKTPSGAVQQLNSLRGAVLVQGLVDLDF